MGVLTLKESNHQSNIMNKSCQTGKRTFKIEGQTFKIIEGQTFKNSGHNDLLFWLKLRDRHSKLTFKIT